MAPNAPSCPPAPDFGREAGRPACAAGLIWRKAAARLACHKVDGSKAMSHRIKLILAAIVLAVIIMIVLRQHGAV